MVKKKSQEQYIKEITEIHKNKSYDFNNIIYINNKTKVKIFCKIHNDFFYKRAGDFLRYNSDCPKCVYKNKKILLMKTTDQVVKEAKKIWGEKYDYSLVNYTGANNKIIIICKIHGKFLKRPDSHIKNNQGCKKCQYKQTEEFILESKKIHGDKYDYSKTIYNGSKHPINIICKKHKLFRQSTAISHLNGSGCNKCNISKGEQKIIMYLEKNGIKYITQKRFKFLDKIIIYDFYIPSKKLFIEYDGKQHFINSFYGNKHLNHQNDIFKNIYIAHKNLTLLRIHYKDNIEFFLTNYFNKKLKPNIYYSRKNYYD